MADTYGIGHAASPAELGQDITILPDGTGLPAGQGTAAEGAKLFVDKGCAGCHGDAGVGGVTAAPNLIGNKGTGPGDDAWKRVSGGEADGALPILAPDATIVWDYIHRGMPLGNEGTLTADEVYSLTAYLFALNKMIPQDMTLNQDNLAKVKMPIGTEWTPVPMYQPGTQRLAGYPH
jgi:cytochrome c